MTINTVSTVIPTPPNPALDNDDAFTLRATPYALAVQSFGQELQNIIPQMNTDIASANVAAAAAVNAPGSSGTTTTSMTIGTGDQTFTTQTGKLWVTGQSVVIASTATPTTFMTGVIKAYNSGTGAMTVNVQATAGSGTLASWNVALTAPLFNLGLQYLGTSGTSTAYTITPSPALGAYGAGTSYLVSFVLASGAAPTLAISGLATPPQLVKQAPDGTYVNIGAGEITAGHRSRVTLINAAQALVETLPRQTPEPSFSAYQNTLVSVPNATYTKMPLTTEEWDTANAFDSVTNYRFQPTVAGIYQITGAVTFGGLSGVGAAIFKNGVEYKRGTIFQPGTAVGATNNVACLVSLNGSTDYVELFGYQSSGSAANTAPGVSNIYMQGALARAA